jgi:hypothetical protein
VPVLPTARSALRRVARGRTAPPAVREVAGLPDEPVVVVELVGGLGNQMFQYAVGRALALRRGVPLLLDLSWFPTQTKQAFGLDRFDLPAAVLEPGRAGRTRQLQVVREQGFHFQAHVLDAPPDVYLTGYWQSERYFADVADVLRRELGSAAGVPQRPPVDGASVHVRRGDYVSEPETNAYHGTCSLAYYRRAMEIVHRLADGPVDFAVFSDDPQWAQEQLAGPGVQVVSGPGRTAHDDLLDMARYRHHVLANSSFSWWGAWLSAAEGTTVAPRPWFLTPDSNTKDLLPPAWLTVGG